MPAALPADWPAIKLMAIQGQTLEELAEMTGISINTLKARSTREGWKKPEAITEKHQAKIAAAVQNGQMQQSATNMVDLVQSTLLEKQKQVKLGLASWAAESSGHLGTLRGEEALAAHQPAVSVASVMTKIWPEQAAPSVRISMFAPGQVVDIEAEVIEPGCGTDVEQA